MGTPSSVRFDDAVAARLAQFVATHPGLSASSATNLLVDEALRGQDHPLVVFRDGPAGRRARLIGGPDVWEVVRAVRSARAAERELSPDQVIALVAETSGIAEHLVRAALDYWGDYPDDVDVWVDRAEREGRAAQERWRREHRLLAG